MARMKPLQRCSNIMSMVQNVVENLSLRMLGGSIYSNGKEKILFIGVEGINGVIVPRSKIKKILQSKVKEFDITEIVLNWLNPKAKDNILGF